ncbi:probable palmitoyltransferase ZDHHC24 [Drosophila eugracilis]|uniref:probable palmitoyltransferase ZDHHC24 n=1 Tax=Drosophila eugracilis TaxID=29029 RepID=UPI0007E893E8|nr:probable palmitoyltransferase ZDHHC24 [Drosophila eugracilis]
MILRSWDRVKPRSISDLACFLLVAIFVPVTYIFHVTIVMPELFAIGGFWYTLMWVASLFIIFNITSNMLACMLVDTSIRMELLQPPVEPAQLVRWHKCHDCQTLVPPRSWHCDVCNVCVLKRDHHCRFTCCCIGHHNYRYFFYYLVYMIIGSLAAAIMESIYLWHLHPDVYCRWSTLCAVFAPVVSLTLNPSWETFYVVIYDLTLLGFAISSLLLVFHWEIVRSGSVTRERGSRKYDRGLRGNLEMVLGKRMNLTWLSPFLRSDLPHNGVNWVPIGTASKED